MLLTGFYKYAKENVTIYTSNIPVDSKHSLVGRIDCSYVNKSFFNCPEKDCLILQQSGYSINDVINNHQ